MTASRINMTPGLSILHSSDLVHWQIIGHAMQQQPRSLLTSKVRRAE